MSDPTTTTSTPATPTSTSTTTSSSAITRTPGSRVSGTSSGTPSTLRTEHGTTTIADNVVAKIAALAAREVSGVAELGGAVSGAISGVMGRITGSSSNEPKTGGVSVEVGETQAAVDLTLKAQYPASIHEVADAVRQNVMDRIQSMTGLEVVEVNINVVDLLFPGEETDSEDTPKPSRVE